MAQRPFNSQSGYSVGVDPQISVIDSGGNIVALNLTANASANLGSISNLTILGGSNGQFLRTAGNGSLSFASVTATPAGSNTQVQFNDDGSFGGSANLTFNRSTNVLSVNSVSATSLTATANVSGGNLTTGGALSVTGNANVGNLGATNIVGTLTTASQNNITSLGTLSSLTVSGNTTTGNLTVNSNTVLTGNTFSGSIPAGTYTVAPLNLNNTGTAGTVKTQLNLINTAGGVNTGSAIDFYTYLDQPSSVAPGARLAVIDDGNFSGNFNLLSKSPGSASNPLVSRLFIGSSGRVGVGNTAPAHTLSVGGTLNANGNISTNANLILGNIGIYPQGNDGFSVNENFNAGSSVETAYHWTSGTGRSNIVFTTAISGQLTTGFGTNGNSTTSRFVTFSEGDNTTFEYRRGVGISPVNLSGGTLLANIANTGTMWVLGTITGGNLSTAGTLSVTGNANVGNIGATNGVFTNVSGNGATLTSITGANVTGTVSAATTSGTVTANAQPNITSVGTLTSLTVSGNTTTGNANLGNLVTANFFSGNGSLLTGLPAGTQLVNGNSNIVVSANANITMSTKGAERLRIDTSGNVGIGTITPIYKLEVIGSFAATDKSFVIKHPTKPGMKLRYGTIEAPYHGIRLTGKSEVINGKAEINLPDYICGLVKEDGVNIQITNIGHDQVLWVDEIDVPNHRFMVGGPKSLFFSKTYKFYWTFSAIRKDVEELITEYKES